MKAQGDGINIAVVRKDPSFYHDRDCFDISKKGYHQNELNENNVAVESECTGCTAVPMTELHYCV